MPDENGNLLPGEDGYVPVETPVEETAAEETIENTDPSVEESTETVESPAENKETENVAAPDEDEHFETFEEHQAAVRASQPNTPRPDHENSFGHPFYQGSPDVDPSNPLLEFAKVDPDNVDVNKENH